MRNWTSALLLILLVGSTGCTRDNPQFCNSATDCDNGETCALPEHECRATGDWDAGADSGITSCEDSTECTVATAPICDENDEICRACAANPECVAKDPLLPVCAVDGSCVECDVHTDCTDGAEPICDDMDQECRACGSSTECVSRDPDVPFCQPSGACVECEDHDDCESLACDRATGSCLDQGDIIYVDDDSSNDSSGCGARMNACKTLSTALGEVTMMRKTIVMIPAVYFDDVAISGIDVAIIGPGASLRQEATEKPSLLVSSGSQVEIDGLKLFLALGVGVNADGLHCTDEGSFVRLTRAEVSGNGASGIDIRAGCEAVVEDSVVTDNVVRGIHVESSEITLERTLVSNNEFGGLEVENSAFRIVNNFIVDNGTLGDISTGSDLGGVLLFQDTTIANKALDEETFAFNTVAGNKARDLADAHGVICDTLTAFSVTGNVVYDNSGGAATVAGACTWEYSNVEGGVTGSTNIDLPPTFDTPASGNYHLVDGSAGQDVADPATGITLDFDGQDRPQGDGFDMGADEIAP